MSGNTYSSIPEMVSDTDLSEESKKDILDHIARRQIVKHLIAIRALRDMSQHDLAKSMECSQSRISKIESGFDCELNIETLLSYCNAIELDMQLFFMPKNRTIMDEIKFYAFQIKDRMDYMAKLSHKDEKIASGVAKAFGELLFNMVNFVYDCAQAMPAKRSGGLSIANLPLDKTESDEKNLLPA